MILILWSFLLQSCPNLTTIEPLTFASLSNLVLLDVEGNLKLRNFLSPQFSADQDGLEIILLAKNDLLTLQSETFSLLPNLAVLRIRDNALRCDCNLKWIPEELDNPKYIWSKDWADNWSKLVRIWNMFTTIEWNELE